MRQFDGGATRNVDASKYDYEGFLHPEVLHAYGAYMHSHRMQADGSLRDSDNWQKGIPTAVYLKSLIRHTFDLWRLERGSVVLNPDTGEEETTEHLCCAIMFNVMGFLKEILVPAGPNVP